MKEMNENQTDHQSWFNKLMGGPLTTGEKIFTFIILSSLCVWPLVVAALALVWHNFYRTNQSAFLPDAIWLLIIGWPIYIFPLLIITSKVSKRWKKPALFYILPVTFLVIVVSVVIAMPSFIPMPTPKGADPSTYRWLGEQDTEGYSLDAHHAFYGMDSIPGADPTTFRLIGISGYAADKNRVYYLGETVKGAQAKTFKLLDSAEGYDQLSPFYGLAFDGKEYYCGARALHLQDPKTLQKAGDWYYDKYKIYYIDIICEDSVPSVALKDHASFKPINTYYAKDKYQVYYEGSVVKGADPKTFHVFHEYEDDENYGQDKNRLYYKDKATEVKDYKKLKRMTDSFETFFTDGTTIYTSEFLKMPAGTDAKTLKSLTDDIWSKDKARVYWKNKIVEGADPAIFSQCPSLELRADDHAADNNKDIDYGTDGHHIFYHDSMLVDADCATFVCGVDTKEMVSFAFDKNRYYEGHETRLIRIYKKGAMSVQHQ